MPCLVDDANVELVVVVAVVAVGHVVCRSVEAGLYPVDAGVGHLPEVVA